jgi:hypothetical protein
MKRMFAMLLFATVASVNTWGQAGFGGITGTVRDASGSSVPGAKVVVKNDQKGVRREMQTTSTGLFNAPLLVPASGYAVEVETSGFTKFELKDITIQVGSNVELEVNLQVAGTATQVDVSASAPIVEDTKSGITDLVTQEQIDNLPINGRRADTFALLTPGVTRDGTFGLVSFHGISAGNAFLTDGNYTSNAFYSENAGRTRISTQISQDAVQEFQVLSDGYSSEYGRAMGGVINTVTRSGSNDYHGTLYEFFRNRTLVAPDRYALGYNAPEWRHQAGATFGGPIKKDKLFFFSNFELVKRNFPALNRITTTQIADPTGTFVLPSNCKAPATAAQCQAAINFIQAQMNVLVPRSVNSDIGFAKLDYHLNDRNTLTVDFNIMHWVSPDGIQTQSVLPSGAALGNNGNSTVETRYGNADLTTILTPNTLNNFRFGFFKDRLSDPAASQLWPSTGPLYITVASATVGAAEAYPRTYPSEERFQLADTFSWTRGSHSFKFGVDFDTNLDYLKQLFNYAGAYSYSSLTNFALDFSGNSTAKSYSSFSQEFGNPVQNLRTNNLYFFALDSWKINRKLTLNYGLRYEKTFLPQPTLADPNYPQTGRIPGTNKDFAPRISLAYELNEKTVVRVGYGIFYAPYIVDGLDTLFLGNGLYQTSISANPNQAGAPLFPNAFPNVNAVPAGTAQLTFAQPGFHNPYSEQATLAVQRQLAQGLDLTVSYNYTRGIGLITAPDVNLSAPSITRTYTIDDSLGNAVGSFTTPIWTTANKVDPRYSHIYVVGNGGDSWYNGLSVQLRKRFAHGFTGQFSYTWSHAIDDAQQSGASTTITYNQSSTYNGNFALDKGSSATDQRHRAVINWTYAPTIVKSDNWAARYLINGWQLSTITTMASSQPTSGTISVSGQQFSGITMAYTTEINGLAGWNRVPFLPVNNTDIDRQYTVDARLVRNLPFTDRIKGMLMFEGFNVFNTQYNTGIATTEFTAAGGVIKPQVGFGLGNASQAFPDGTNARRLQAAFRLVF